MESSIDEIEFLARSEHRTGVLEVLAQHQCNRNELCRSTGASSPTMGRILADFEERRWVVRNGPIYELTPLGEFVADKYINFRRAMETERNLRDIVPLLPREMDDFAVDLLANATVSYPGPGYPYEPVDRFIQLIETTDRMRGFGTTVLEANALEAACRAIIDGMEFEFIYPPDVIETIFDWNPPLVAEASACENCTDLVHDDLPDGDWCGIAILDDRVCICCTDEDTGMLKAVIDTDSPETLAWGESIYERYRNEAVPLEEDDIVTL